MLLPAVTAPLVLFSPRESMVESSWQNVVLETPSVFGTTTEAVLSTFPVGYLSVWTDFISLTALQQDAVTTLYRCVVEINIVQSKMGLFQERRAWIFHHRKKIQPSVRVFAFIQYTTQVGHSLHDQSYIIDDIQGSADFHNCELS